MCPPEKKKKKKTAREHWYREGGNQEKTTIIVSRGKESGTRARRETQDNNEAKFAHLRVSRGIRPKCAVCVNGIPENMSMDPKSWLKATIRSPLCMMRSFWPPAGCL